MTAATRKLTPEPLDITTLMRVDIMQRDWKSCHETAERRKPLPEWWGKRR